MAVKLTPAQWADKLARNLKNASQDIQNGVNAVQTAPGQKAAAQSQKWINSLNEASTQEKWRRNVAAVSLEDWKKAMLDKGLARIGPGIDAAKPKIVQFAEEVTPHIEAGQRQLEQMPDLTLQDSINRAVTWITHMSEFRRRG